MFYYTMLIQEKTSLVRWLAIVWGSLTVAMNIGAEMVALNFDSPTYASAVKKSLDLCKQVYGDIQEYAQVDDDYADISLVHDGIIGRLFRLKESVVDIVGRSIVKGDEVEYMLGMLHLMEKEYKEAQERLYGCNECDLHVVYLLQGIHDVLYAAV